MAVHLQEASRAKDRRQIQLWGQQNPRLWAFKAPACLRRRQLLYQEHLPTLVSKLPRTSKARLNRIR